MPDPQMEHALQPDTLCQAPAPAQGFSASLLLVARNGGGVLLTHRVCGGRLRPALHNAVIEAWI
jgi:hypothetical protein